jgi:hypothetical protein
MLVHREGKPSSDFDFAKYKVKFDAGLFLELQAEAALFHADMTRPAVQGFGVTALGMPLSRQSVSVTETDAA